jgi:hypothetical protein
MNQSINQSINQSMNQSINQSLLPVTPVWSIGHPPLTATELYFSLQYSSRFSLNL